MLEKLYKNSYLVAILTFIILLIIFYAFSIGTTFYVENEKIKRRYNWQYPLAIALIVWVVWHFLLFPQKDNSEPKQNFVNDAYSQKINMETWN